MRKFLLALATGGLIAAAANAALADGPPAGRSVKDAPVYSPPINWTGFYVAAGAGYGMWTADTTTINPATGLCVLCVPQTQGGRGALGTFGIGYDAQLRERFVVGVFVDGSLSRIKGTIQDQGPFFAGTIEENHAFSVGARFGTLVSPSVLAYGTAGYSRAHFTNADMVTTSPARPRGSLRRPSGGAAGSLAAARKWPCTRDGSGEPNTAMPTMAPLCCPIRMQLGPCKTALGSPPSSKRCVPSWLQIRTGSADSAGARPKPRAAAIKSV